MKIRTLIKIAFFSLLHTYCFGQNAKSDYFYQGGEDADSIYVFIPDSIYLFSGSIYEANTPLGCDYFVRYYDGDGLELEDTIVYAHVNYRRGVPDGNIEYYLDNKYLIFRGYTGSEGLTGTGYFYDADTQLLRGVATFSNGLFHGLCLRFRIWESNGSPLESLNVSYFNNGKYQMTISTNLDGYVNFYALHRGNKVRSFITTSPTEYSIDVYKTRPSYQPTRYIEVDAEHNRIKDGTKKKGYRIYWWGYVYDLFHSKDELRSERWLRRKLSIKKPKKNK